MITVYTAIYWAYDQLLPIVPQDIECQFIVFTDRQYYSKDRKVAIKDFNGIPNHLKSRYIKTHSHSLPFVKDDFSIWIDGNVVIKRPDFVRKIAEAYKGWILCLKNDERNSIAEEMDILFTKERFKDQRAKIEEQRDYYKNTGYGFDNWFSWNCIMARDNSPEVAKFNSIRRDHIIQYSYRDMLSMEYVSRYTHTPIHHLEWKWVDNEYMTTRFHLWLKT